MARVAAIPTLQAILQAVKRWESDYTIPRTDGTIPADYTVKYYFVPSDGKPREIVEDMCDGTRDGWPMPGRYEIDITDSNGESLLDKPFAGEHFDRDSMPSTGHPAVDGMRFLFDEARLNILDARADSKRAKGELREVEKELAIVREQLGKALRENANFQLSAEKAISEKEIAEARQKEAEDRLAEVEEQVSMFKPHIAMAVDMGMKRFGQWLGLPANVSDEGAPPEEDWDPPPKGIGIEDPHARLQDLYQAALYDPAGRRYLFERGLLTWPQIRALMWLITKRDVGPEPVFENEEEAAVEEEADAEHAAAE